MAEGSKQKILAPHLPRLGPDILHSGTRKQHCVWCLCELSPLFDVGHVHGELAIEGRQSDVAAHVASAELQVGGVAMPESMGLNA